MIWEPNKTYLAGQIVYPSDNNGLYYVCLVGGKSRDTTVAISGENEPLWMESGLIEDGFIIWRPMPHDSNPSVDTWEPNKSYHKGDKVHPASGNFQGLYSYILANILSEPVWPIEHEAVFTDGSITWQAKISTQIYIPKNLRNDALYAEFYRLLDYLLESNTPVLNDFTQKFKNRENIQIEALESFIGEQGYDYIVSVLDLTKDQLETLSNYLNLIHFLKGTRKGLELVLKLLGIVTEITEWWEEEPKGEPHTFSLDINFNLGNVKTDTVERLTSFVGHYVFPKLKSIVVNFETELANLETYVSGTYDTDTYIEGGGTFLLNVATTLQIETTVYAIMLPEPTKVLSPLPNTGILLFGNKVLALP